jgi:hypothetical protein
MSQLVTKDFYKADVYRFDVEEISDNTVRFDISNVISWDIISTKITKNELKGLADFINKYLDND